MKAILVTRCGCSRMVNVPDGCTAWHIPMLSHYDLGAFRDEDTQHLDECTATELRTFRIDFTTPFVLPEGGAYVFREVKP